MSPVQDLEARARRLIMLQCMIGTIVAAFFLLQTPVHALSAGYGAAISIFSALWLSRGVARASREAGQDARKKGEAILYVSAALRFLMVLALFAIGLLVVKLVAIPMVTGFVLAQLAFVIVAGWRAEAKK